MDPEEQNLLQEWKLAVDKNSDRFWHNPTFREAYATELQFYGWYYERTVKSDVQDCIEDLLAYPRPRARVRDNRFASLEFNLQSSLGGIFRQVSWSSSNTTSSSGLTVRVLSLGCGPGIDVLAIVRLLADDDRVASIQCVGVDLLSHPMGGLINELERVADQNPGLCIAFKGFSGVDAKEFVNFCNGANFKFDLVSARYINAIDKLPMFYGPVPSLIGSVGKVLLLDNYSRALDGLAISGGYAENRRLRRTGQWQGRIYLVFQQPGPA